VAPPTEPSWVPADDLSPLPGPFRLWFHTTRHLSAAQVWAQFRCRLQRYLERTLPHRVARALEALTPAEPPLRHLEWPRFLPGRPTEVAAAWEAARQRRFTFLNVTREFPGGIAWHNPDLTYLWDFSLHYFGLLGAAVGLGGGLTPGPSPEGGGGRTTAQALRCAQGDTDSTPSPQPSPSERERGPDTSPPGEEWVWAWLRDWIAANPPPSQPGWQPYVISRRIANWTKWLSVAGRPARPTDAGAILRSLYQQALYLERHLERHLRGNHLLENGRALVLAGACFSGPDAERWLRTGLRLCRQEAEEEVLADGGHFERSPMYHCLVLEALLDTVQVARAVDLEPEDLVDVALRNMYPLEALQDAVEVSRVWGTDLTDAARRMARALPVLCHPDGGIALLNDSACGIAPAPADLLAYATEVLGEVPAVEEDVLPQTGYVGLGRGGDRLLLDAGAIGPEYVPGHAHADTLSFELSVGGKRVIVDSGVYDYDPGPARGYCRGTAAHNTVRVDGLDQSEVWASFRVARRARPGEVHWGRRGDLSFVTAAHDGYERLPGRVGHRRQVVHAPGPVWLVCDRLSGEGEHRVQSYLHFAPGLKLEQRDHHWVALQEGVPCLYVAFYGVLGPTLRSGWYCPEFGRREQNAVLVLDGVVALPVTCGYVLSGAADPPEPAWDEEQRRVEVRLGPAGVVLRWEVG